MAQKNIRLSCMECDRQDFDGIDAATLKKCKRAGWEDISREQTYEQSIKTYNDDEEVPPYYSALDWFTHLGICPECKEL